MSIVISSLYCLIRFSFLNLSCDFSNTSSSFFFSSSVILDKFAIESSNIALFASNLSFSPSSSSGFLIVYFPIRLFISDSLFFSKSIPF